jgi:hypothetical protein
VRDRRDRASSHRPERARRSRLRRPSVRNWPAWPVSRA